MGRTTRHQQIVYLDHDKAAILDRLSRNSRVPKQVYLREGVDMVLHKYSWLWLRRRPGDGRRKSHALK